MVSALIGKVSPPLAPTVHTSGSPFFFDEDDRVVLIEEGQRSLAILPFAEFASR
jgi:hypothetical protein